MNTLRRLSRKAKIRLESLEDRITPAVHPGSAHLAALLAHTNVIVRREPPPPFSNPSGHKGHELHRLHRNTQPSTIGYMPGTTSVNTIPLSFQPAVVLSTRPTTIGAGTTSIDAKVGSNPTITPPVSLPPPANLAAPLVQINEEFQAASGKTPFTSAYGSQIEIEGSGVGVEIHGNGGNLDTLLVDMDKLGFQLSITSTATDTIAGLIPIDALAKAAQDPLTLSVTPEYLPQPFGTL